MGKGGGSPAPAPSSQTVTNTSIPEYARPYVENMLGKSEALTDINANPYQAYGGQRVQDFTPMQQQAFQGVGNMQVAPEIGAGSGMAALAGLGSLGAGSNYMNMATDPRATQAFMSPYMQNVVDTQKAEAFRDFQKGLGALNQRAVGSGAFGGSRAALERAEANRNLNTQLANIQAQGTQNAFQAAQQAQQFGSSLGMQGLGQGLQAASTLGQLGQTGYGQRMGILGEQQKVGAVQQAQGQQALDLAYQDFLKQKNYPYTQLGFMSDMLRGLPLSQSAQQIYTAPPNVASQLGGLGMAGLGIYGMSGGFKGAKEGGAIKGYKDGGSIGYLGGGQIEMMNKDQLEKLLASPNLKPVEVAMIEERLAEIRRMEMNPEAGEMMARSGIGSIATGDMVPQFAAEGGIIAFSSGAKVNKPEGYDERRAKLVEQQSEIFKRLESPDAWAKTTAAEERLSKDIAAGEEALPWRTLTALGLGKAVAASEPGGQNRGFLGNLAVGGDKALGEYARGLSQIGADKKLALQQGVEAEKAKYGRDVALHNALMGNIGQMDSKEIGLMNAKNQAAALASDKEKLLFQKATQAFTTAVTKEKEALMKDKKNTFDYTKNPQKLEADAQANVLERMKKFDPEALKALRLNPEIMGSATPTPAPGATSTAVNANKPKTFTTPSNAAISALKSRKDQKEAMAEFDEIFGPGAAQKALAK
jgi:hypothetical protein